MKVGKLKEILNEVPDDAEVFIWADHGQDYEHPDNIFYSKGEETDDGDAMIWQRKDATKEDLLKLYDEEDVEEYPIDGKVTAVSIEY